MGTGLYFGYIYGNAAVFVLDQVPQTVAYNPWAKVVQFAPWVLPVAGIAGFASVVLALVLPYIIAINTNNVAASKKYDEALSAAAAAAKAVENPLLGADAEAVASAERN